MPRISCYHKLTIRPWRPEQHPAEQDLYPNSPNLLSYILYGSSLENWQANRSALLVSERSGLEPWPRVTALCCVVFLGEIVYCQSASVHPGVYMGTTNRRNNAWGGGGGGGVTINLTSIPSREEKKYSQKPGYAPAVSAIWRDADLTFTWENLLNKLFCETIRGIA